MTIVAEDAVLLVCEVCGLYPLAFRNAAWTCAGCARPEELCDCDLDEDWSQIE